MSVLRLREAYQREECERLAPWAVASAASAGRVVAEPEHAYRTPFQRDRDRVIHSRAFRRLEYKTQVFVYHEGDHYRNRLTHTLEGAQVARTLARVLRLNEDLAEAIVLAHDLGHTPFGHAGERALDGLLGDDGGFDHNRQSLRVVDLLEERSPGYRGLNLTWETREGITKHGVAWPHPVPLPEPTPQPSLEAQLADLSDEVAYASHDLDDGLRAGLLHEDELSELGLWQEAEASIRARVAGQPGHIRRAQTVRAVLDVLATDLVESSGKRLEQLRPASPAEVRAADGPCIVHSEAGEAGRRALKRLLFERFYQHPRVVRMNRKAERVLGDLFAAYRDDPQWLPEHVRARFAGEGEARAIADYIAGMTDRFALAEHRRVTDPHVPV